MPNYADCIVTITDGDPKDIERIKHMVQNDFYVYYPPIIKENGTEIKIDFQTRESKAFDHLDRVMEAGKNSTIDFYMDVEFLLVYHTKRVKGIEEEFEAQDPGLFWAGYWESDLTSWSKLFKCPDCGKKHYLEMAGEIHEGHTPAYGKTYQCSCGNTFDLEGYKNKVINDRNFDHNIGLFDQPEYFMKFAGDQILESLKSLDEPGSINKIHAVAKDLLRVGHKIKLDRATEEFLDTGKLPSTDWESKEFINEIIDLAAITKERRAGGREEMEDLLNKPSKAESIKEKLIQQAGPDVAEFLDTGKMPMDADPETMKKIVMKALEVKQQIKEQTATNEEMPF